MERDTIGQNISYEGTTPGAVSPSAIALLIAGLVTFAMGQTVLFAVLGPIAREIGLRELHVGVVITASALAVVVTSPIWGRTADRWGRKPVFVVGLTGYPVTTFVFAGLLEAGMAGLMMPVVAFSALVVARVAYGVLASAIQPSSSAYMADVTDEKNRSAGMAAIGAAFGIGSILGPAMGGALSGFGLVVPVIVAASLALVIGLAAWLKLPEPVRHEAETRTVLSATDARLLPPILLTLTTFACVAIIQQTTAFFVQDRFSLTAAETAKAVGYLVAGMALAMLLVQAVIVQIFKPSPAVLIRAGLPVGLAGAAMVLVAADFLLLSVAYGLIGLGFGMLFPGVNAAASVRVSAHEQGAALGLIAAAMSGGYVIGPLLGTALYETAFWLPMALVVAITGLAIPFSWFVRWQPDGKHPR